MNIVGVQALKSTGQNVNIEVIAGVDHFDLVESLSNDPDYSLSQADNSSVVIRDKDDIVVEKTNRSDIAIFRKAWFETQIFEHTAGRFPCSCLLI